ncbi:MAG: response regulator [Magnetospirillum sp.]|nr:response regulator [Magnetospirillum sp.]
MLVQIVDDNETNLMLFEQLALKVGSDIQVETYADPLVALASCKVTMPDMIVVDYMMPGMDGHEYVEAIRQIPSARDVPIVMVTAAADRTVRQKALELGVSDFLAKPVDPSEVRVRFANLLALRRSHLQLRDRNRWLAEEISKATATVIEREQELVLRLSKAAEFRDPETGAHIVRMACYSELIARRLGLPNDICELLLRAAPMHDLGKLGIPDGILLKPGRLTEDEFAIMSRHPEIGHEILAESDSQLIRMGAEIALSHHEKFDGTGYPRRLAGDAIPLMGRIVAVADVFDALTSERPYKAAWPAEKARKLLEDNSGSHFDPACVRAFLEEWDQVNAIRESLVDEPIPLTF